MLMDYPSRQSSLLPFPRASHPVLLVCVYYYSHQRACTVSRHCPCQLSNGSSPSPGVSWEEENERHQAPYLKRGQGSQPTAAVTNERPAVFLSMPIPSPPSWGEFNDFQVLEF